jgi:hypothetical protein
MLSTLLRLESQVQRGGKRRLAAVEGLVASARCLAKNRLAGIAGRLLTVALFSLTMAACSSVISSQTGKLADNLSTAIYNNNDIESVGQAIPTFLVLIDGMIESSPDNPDLLSTAAQLNDAYGGLFVDDAERSARFSDKALAYAWRAMCAHRDKFCDWPELDHKAYAQAVSGLEEDDLPYAYALAVSWLNWIRSHSDDWNAIAQLPRPEQILEQVVALDDSYADGMAHLYLGGIATLIPPALGGKPEKGRAHFERAIDISDGQNMMAKVVFAQQYARLMFDQPLHHRLLTEVLEADPNTAGYVLMNSVAQQQAGVLLASEAEYF